jgi:hypothetical protein
MNQYQKVMNMGSGSLNLYLVKNRKKNKDFKGQIADVRLYDSALTESSILILAAAILPLAHTTTATAGVGGSISPI